MLSIVFLIALSNVIAGRWKDIIGYKDENGKEKPGGRWVVIFFRCAVPALVVAQTDWISGIAVFLGSLLWATPGWSFDEITGKYDPNKYPHWMRAIGLWAFPLDNVSATNRKRGILIKGVRGGYDILTFILLSALNPYAMLWFLGTFTMGFWYWLAGKIWPSKAVIVAELLYGFIRGFLLLKAAGI